MRIVYNIHDVNNLSQRRCYRSTSTLSMALLLVIIPVESSVLFGRPFLASAIFKNNQGDKSSNVPEETSKPPPPPPPGQASTPNLSAQFPKPEVSPEERGKHGAEVDPGLQNPKPPPPPLKQGNSRSISNSKPIIALKHPPESSSNWMSEHSSQEANQGDGQHQWSRSREGGLSYSQQQHYPYFPQMDAQFDRQQHTNQWPTLEEQLQSSFAREQDLYNELQNLTETISTLRQQDSLHLRQMDVLTERIMEAEATIFEGRSNALEYQTNCTEFANQIGNLHQELSDWQNRCAEFADAEKKNEYRIKELKKNLNEARAEAENLAISIENARVRDHMDESRLKKKKSRGLFGWLSFILSSSSESESDGGAERKGPQVIFWGYGEWGSTFYSS